MLSIPLLLRRQRFIFLALPCILLLLIWFSGRLSPSQWQLPNNQFADAPKSSSSSWRSRPAADSVSNCTKKLQLQYGVDRFSRVPWQDDTANITFPTGLPVQDAHACSPGLSTNKVAVMIEMRAHIDWTYHLVYFVETLPADWPFVIYHSKLNERMLYDDPVLQPYLLSGKVQLHLLNTKFPTTTHVSRFLTSRAFYKALAPADHILLFQIDSTLCRSATSTVENFFQYAFVGAPCTLPQTTPVQYNGGFSLRNRTAFLQVIDSSPDFESEDYVFHLSTFEDRWFSHHFARLQKSFAFKLPTFDESRAFAVEAHFHPFPVGVHRPRKWSNRDQLQVLLRNCPEADQMPDFIGDHFDPCANDPEGEQCMEQQRQARLKADAPLDALPDR